jgi:CubicO group peptidase (beta-lactamase class C family)
MIGVSQGRRPDAEAIARAVDSLAAAAVTAGIAPALGVAIAIDGKTVLAKSYGMADATAGVGADDRTLWYLASTSKSLTGFGVALLADRGTLRLDVPITTLLPGSRWNPGADPARCTLGHFLSHTHGLNDHAVVSSAAFTGAIPEARWPSLLALAAPNGSSDLIYSNFGYNVAAMVIDRLRPEGWKRYLEEAVYRPAGLRETYARVSGLEPRRIARPHRLRPDGSYVTETFFKIDATMNSAGGHLATVADLARWTIVHMDSGMIDGRRVFPASAVALSHRILGRQTRDQAKRFAFFDREGWGAGWDVGSYEGERMVSRFGSYHTTRSHLSFLPARRIGVVAMSTGGLGSSLTDVVASFAYDMEAGRADARTKAEQRIAELRLRLSNARNAAATADSASRARRALVMDRSLADFAGTYADPSFGEVSFSVSGNQLAYRWGAVHGPVEIADVAKRQFRLEIAGSGTIATFEIGATGGAGAVTLQGVRFARVADDRRGGP